jgi:hypothetical protein
MKNPYCLTYNNDGICTECTIGYYLNEEQNCMINPENCINAKADGTCLECVGGFIENNGICIKELPFCTVYSPITHDCV